MLNRHLAMALIFTAMLGGRLAHAQSMSPLIPVQGVLADADGTPRTGTFEVTVRFYNSAIGGTPLFEESQDVNFDDAGRFHLFVGAFELIPDGFFRENSTLYIGPPASSKPHPHLLVRPH